MNISASYYSAIGGRENNEDAVTLLESSESVIGVVADGLGGHRDGELASKIAINTINAAIAHQEVSQQVLRKAVALANSRILEDREHTSMKTTLDCVPVQGSQRGADGLPGGGYHRAGNPYQQGTAQAYPRIGRTGGSKGGCQPFTDLYRRCAAAVQRWILGEDMGGQHVAGFTGSGVSR